MSCCELCESSSSAFNYTISDSPLLHPTPEQESRTPIPPKLEGGIHTGLRVTRYITQGEIGIWTFKLQLLEIIDDLKFRKIVNSIVATSDAGLEKTIRPRFVTDTSPFTISNFEILPSTDILEDNNQQLTVLRINSNISVGNIESQSITRGEITLHTLNPGCFDVKYRCHCDRCGDYITYPCNCRCQTKICGNYGQCSDWRDNDSSCFPFCSG